jgi:hypothetical protein
VNAARYYERVPNDLAIRALSNEAGLGTTSFNGWDLTTGQPTNQGGNSSIRGGKTRVEDGTKLPYVDELVLGWQQEVGRDVSYEIRGIYREQGRALEDVQFNTVEATENPAAFTDTTLTRFAAVVFLLARHLLSQMDVPTRQAYVMAVVEDHEREAAAALTNVARTVAQALSPVATGWLMQAVALGAPFTLGGGLKIVYDLLLWRTFRDVTPRTEDRGAT